MPHPRRLVTLLVALPLVLTGCLGFGKDDEPVDTSAVNDTNESEVPETLPDGREFVAGDETNKTEEGVGGVIHQHDYWKGKEQVTIYDRDVPVSGFFERGDNSKVGIGFINLETLPGGAEDEPALVYEGTGKVTFTLTKGTAWADSYQVTFRTAAQDWTPWQPIRVGESIAYEPEKIETDMPHSFRSLWNWKIQATGPAPVTGEPLFGGTVGPAEVPESKVHAVIVVDKARNVDDWPGHPAFYDGVGERIVAQEKSGSTTVQQAADVLLYGVEPDQVVPDKLISMGSHTLDVYVNITQLTFPPGVPNGGFTLYWRTADTRPDDLGIFSIANETDDATFAYWHLQLDENMVDSPYQPASRFGFKVLANPVNDDAAACYRCVPYEIKYTMTIIARPDPAAVPASMDE